jgi:hypothetical protein
MRKIVSEPRDRALAVDGPRKFCEKSQLRCSTKIQLRCSTKVQLQCSANEISRTQFVANFDRCGRNVRNGLCVAAKRGRSLTTILAFVEFPPCFLLVKLDVAVAAGDGSYENFCVLGGNCCWYGSDAERVRESRACGDGKRLRRTRRLLRKSHSQWRARKLFSNDGGSSPIALWHEGSRLSQRMRHSSH